MCIFYNLCSMHANTVLVVQVKWHCLQWRATLIIKPKHSSAAFKLLPQVSNHKGDVLPRYYWLLLLCYCSHTVSSQTDTKSCIHSFIREVCIVYFSKQYNPWLLANNADMYFNHTHIQVYCCCSCLLSLLVISPAVHHWIVPLTKWKQRLKNCLKEIL